MAGSEGMSRMLALMAKLRAEPPAELAGQKVVRVRDYQHGQQWAPGEAPTPLAGPRGDMVMLDLAENGNYIAVRPSGTEPKVKFYQFAFVPAEQLADLESTKTEIQRRLDQIESDLRSYADAVE
jgi:phosphoglucomutase/phosphomannomutase